MFQTFEGSTRTFAALLDVMLEQQRVGLCVFTPRTNSTTFIVAMIPQVSNQNFLCKRVRNVHYILIRIRPQQQNKKKIERNIERKWNSNPTTWFLSHPITLCRRYT